MTADLALQLMGEMLFASLLVAGPILGISMVVGLAISVLQVVTQVQEMSLSFVPKIIAVIATHDLPGAVDAQAARHVRRRRDRQHPGLLLAREPAWTSCPTQH